LKERRKDTRATRKALIEADLRSRRKIDSGDFRVLAILFPRKSILSK